MGFRLPRQSHRGIAAALLLTLMVTPAVFASQGPGGGPGTASPLTQIVMATVVYGGAALILAAGLIGSLFVAGLELTQRILLEGLTGYLPLKAAGELFDDTRPTAWRPWLLWIIPAIGALIGAYLGVWLTAKTIEKELNMARQSFEQLKDAVEKATSTKAAAVLVIQEMRDRLNEMAQHQPTPAEIQALVAELNKHTDALADAIADHEE